MFDKDVGTYPKIMGLHKQIARIGFYTNGRLGKFKLANHGIIFMDLQF